MGEEILLLKIELDPGVASVFQHAMAPRFNLDLVPDPRRRGIDTDYNTHFSQESNQETDKADGFADDNSNATLAEYGSLHKINRNLTSLENHFDDVIIKITRIIEFWERFNLTMCGRINICKTFMLSQIGYLGCIITPKNPQIKRMQKIMDDFCTGTTRVAKKKLYAPVGEGGLGLIKISDFITALQCAWIK
jgi:hypothetical protein